jgi:hypothetical protein
LEGDISGAASTPVSGGEGGTLVISGTGAGVTDDFPLEARGYQVTLDLASGCCISLILYGPSGSEEYLFTETFSQNSGGSVSDIFQITESGMYFIDARTTESEWTVTFEPR